jgi:NADPH-dependent 2,4-dienoyl-CoA reductase/sulfur reductase-like enzyme/rhodanese-related sulfurtransferase
MFEKDEHVSFANCGLPYYIGGEITEREDLLVVKPELFERRFDIKVRTRHEVLSIDRSRKVVLVENRANGEKFEEPYDKLILAPGAAPIVPPMALPPPRNVMTLRNVADSDRIRRALLGPEALSPRNAGQPLQALIVGCGYVGLEMVEQLQNLGLRTTLVELVDQVLPLLDPEMGNLLREELEAHGVTLKLGAGVADFVVEGDRVTEVVLTNGERIATDIVVLGIGVRPNVKLAVDAGLALGQTGGIATNAATQTSDPDIYAVGDAAEYHAGPTGAPGRIPLAGPANRAGRIAGEHAATDAVRTPMARVLGTSIVRVFGKVAAMTGLTEKLARKLDHDALSVVIVANDHAAYYPGAEGMVLKLVYERTSGKVLGAQAVGGDGVDKRMDVVATALHFGGTVRDLSGLDLAYAPPFGAAKDPVHVAAFVACNVLDGVLELLPPGADAQGMQLVDVRTPGEVAREPAPGFQGAHNIPLDELRSRLSEIDPNRPIALICATGRRSYVAARILAQRGFERPASVAGGVMLRKCALRAG